MNDDIADCRFPIADYGGDVIEAEQSAIGNRKSAIGNKII
jgi:hypothetical protein